MQDKISTLRALARDRIFDALERVIAITESPIEQAVLLALVSGAPEYGGVDYVAVSGVYGISEPGWRVTLRGDRGGEVSVMPQTPVSVSGKNYRLDFAMFVVLEHFGRHPLRFDIECDGHDYHERSKEQAARDRERDRALGADGWLVLRFTGSQIYADPHGVAAEIWSAIRSEMERLAGQINRARGLTREEAPVALVTAAEVRPLRPPPSRAPVEKRRAPSLQGRAAMLPGPVSDAVGLLAAFPRLCALPAAAELLEVCPEGSLRDLVGEMLSDPMPVEEILARLDSCADAMSVRHVRTIVGPGRPGDDVAELEFQKAIIKAKLERIREEHNHLLSRLTRGDAVSDLSPQQVELVGQRRELEKRLRSLGASA